MTAAFIPSMLYAGQFMDGASAKRVPGVGLTVAGHQNGRARPVPPAQAHLELARRLLAQEMHGPADLQAVTDSAERVLQKLLRRLAKLITPIGCQALLSRSLHLARTDFPFLRGLQVGPSDNVWLAGLRTSSEDLEVEEAYAGLAALLGTLVGLVVVFIGEDLTWRLLLDLWELPVLAAHDTEPS